MKVTPNVFRQRCVWLGLVCMVFVLPTGCATTTGSPMLWALDEAGFVNPRDRYTKTHYVTEADIIRITLNTLYLKYIHRDALNPFDAKLQVLAYTEVYDSPETEEPYRAVIFNSEANEDTVLGSIDRLIYGPIQFKGHPIRIRLFVVELDKKDNEKAAQILQAIGSAVSAAQPEAGPAVAVGLEIGKVLTSFNKDDYELQADITFHPTAPEATREIPLITAKALGVPESDRKEHRATLYPQYGNQVNAALRSGHYLLVKAEDPKRKADDLSKLREYLAADFFTYDDDKRETILIFKGGYLWLDSYAADGYDCKGKRLPQADTPEAPETEETSEPETESEDEESSDKAEEEPSPEADQRLFCESGFYDEKTYAVFGIEIGGREADETKMREVAVKQFSDVASLLQDDNHQRILDGINLVGQRTSASLRARQVVGAQNQRVKLDASYRETPAFVAGLIEKLIGEEEKERVDDPKTPEDETYARELNASLLRAIESTVQGFPLSSTLDAGNWEGISSVKEKTRTDPAVLEHVGSGMFRWKPE